MRTVAAMNERTAAVAHASTPAGTSVAVRTAAAIQALIGLGFGGGATWTVVHLLQNGELPMTPWGFRSMAGPFERNPHGVMGSSPMTPWGFRSMAGPFERLGEP